LENQWFRENIAIEFILQLNGLSEEGYVALRVFVLACFRVSF
jgi:hypothetical protein